MEPINGISFEDWACACGNFTQGMSEEEICNILGVEMPVWKKTSDLWSEKLADLMAEDMSVATTYGELFANPKQGKFAHAGAAVPTLEQTLAIAPDFDAYKKIFWHQSKGAEAGGDPAAILKSYGLTLQTWGQLNMHYMKWRNEYMDERIRQANPEEYNKRYQEVTAIEQKWQDHWDKHYAGNEVV